LGFWFAVVGGILLLVCGCGGGLVYWLAGDWIRIGMLPPAEQAKAMDAKLRQFAAGDVAAAEAFLDALDADQVDQAWGMTAPAFRSVTTREEFGKLAATVRSVVGKSKERLLRNVNTRSMVGGSSTTSLVFAATFEKGAGTVSIDLVGGAVQSWKTDSPLCLDAMKRGADEPK
jgi:hypothetical protein